MTISRYIVKTWEDDEKYQPGNEIFLIFWILLLILKRKSRVLRTKGLLTIPFAHKEDKGRGLL
jgi:hypothetical protein